jgi:hypothetical protein
MELTEKYPVTVEWVLIMEGDRVIHNNEIVRVVRIRDNYMGRYVFTLSNGGVAYKLPTDKVHFVGSELGDAISVEPDGPTSILDENSHHNF